MKISQRVEGPLCGALLGRSRHTALRSWQHNSAGAAFHSDAPSRVSRVSPGNRDFSSSSSPRANPKANHCSRSRNWLQSTFAAAFKQITRRCSSKTRPYGTAAPCVAPSLWGRTSSRPAQDKEALSRYIGAGDDGEVEEAWRHHQDPYRRGYAEPATSDFRISDGDDWRYPSPQEVLELGPSQQQIRAKLYREVYKSLRRPARATILEDVYELYTQLPEPRMLFISYNTRIALMRLMGRVQKRDQDSMLRYFALLADLKDAGISVRRTEWNFAMAFASKYVARQSSQELETTLQLWKDMERTSRIVSNDVTFGILFDVASRSGNLNLAEMLLTEMENRGIKPNRYHATSLIYFFGLKQDPQGVRAAFKETVDKGYLIDSATLNCVISASLLCGDEETAETVYDQMKKNQPNMKDMQRKDYGDARVLNSIIDMFTRVVNEHPKMHKAFQDTIDLRPNVNTYKILLEHYAVRVGDLSTVARLLDEMKHMGIPLFPTLFLPLLKGFFRHGGSRGPWSKKRLDGILHALFEAREERKTVGDFRIDTWIVIWALRAMKKCSDNASVLLVWEDLSKIWDVSHRNQEFLENFKDVVLSGRDLQSKGGDWTGATDYKHRKNGTRL